MKRLLTTFIALFIVISFVGGDSKESSKGSSLSAGQQKAVDNSIEFISNSSFTLKDRIDTDIIEIRNATENTWNSVWSEESKIEENVINPTDWVITIGNTSGHDFAVIVCDSSTYEVIGYIAIE